MSADRKAPCIVCKTRKQVYYTKCCTPCQARVVAEDLFEHYGIPREPSWLITMRKRIVVYNQLAQNNCTLAQIAEALELSKSQVTSMVYRAKFLHKIKVVNIRESKFDKAARKPTLDSRDLKNSHGGGKWGVKGCPCTPCIEVRKQSRRDYREIYKPRRQELLELAQKEGRTRKSKKRD